MDLFPNKHHANIINGSNLVHGNLDLDRSVDLNGRDALDNLHRATNESMNDLLRNKINHTLVDSHLQMLPGVGTLSARGLTGRDAEELGGHTHRSRDLDVLAQGHALDISAD